MNDSITFQTCVVAVMPHFAAINGGINAEIADGKILKEQPKRGQIINEVVGKNIQGAASDGSVHKMSCRGGSDGGFRADVGISMLQCPR